MNFDLDEQQQLTRDMIARFLGPIDIADRHMMRQNEGGYPRSRWQSLADLGLLPLIAPEDFGGLGGTMVDLVLVAEALGQGLSMDPWIENAVLPIRLAVAAQDSALVQRLISAESVVAVAIAEPDNGYDIHTARTRANNNRISGHKTLVLGASFADHLLVTLADGKMATLRCNEAHLSLHAYTVLDGSQAAHIHFHDTPALLFNLPRTKLDRVIGDIHMLAAAEMVGLAQVMFDDTLAYVRERHQFGAAIGSFQAIQHRLVECYAALEQARSLVLRTAMLEPASDDVHWTRIAAGTKAYVGELATHIGLEAVQMHGGMGQTDELAIGHALKRVMMLDKLFGDQHHCLRTFARAA